MKNNNYTERYGYKLVYSKRIKPNYYWIDSNGYVLTGSYCWSERAAISLLENRFSEEFKKSYKFHNKLTNIIE